MDTGAAQRSPDGFLEAWHPQDEVCARVWYLVCLPEDSRGAVSRGHHGPCSCVEEGVLLPPGAPSWFSRPVCK